MLTPIRLFGDGKHGHAERIQTFRCQACRTTFSARPDRPLYHLNPPSHQIAIVLSALSGGLEASAAERVFSSATDKRPSRAFLSRAGEHAQTLHEHYFCHPRSPIESGRFSVFRSLPVTGSTSASLPSLPTLASGSH